MLSTPTNEPLAAAVELRQEFLVSSHLGREVELSILLPAGWPSASAAAYPVLYLNDGQDLPRLHLVQTLDRLFSRHILQPFVLVAIHANEERMYEYGIAAQADYNDRGNKAAAYTRFVVDELLPFVQHTYKVSANPAEAVFAGFSLGGLTAFDLVWHHPELFARAGVFSGSFWWRSRGLDDGYTPADRIIHGLVGAKQPHATHQFWLQTGTLDERGDRNGNGVIDAIDDCLDLIELLVQQGLEPARQLRYVQLEGGHHHPDTWGRIMPDFLQWAFGAATAQPLARPLPVVRAQLDQMAELEPELVAVPAAAETAAHLLAVEAAVSTEILNIIAEPALEDECPEALPVLPIQPMSITRPTDGDYLPYYATYIDLVPADVDPRQLLHEQIAEIQAAFGNLTDEQALQVYAPGKWTSKQMLLHIIDTERVFAYRALRFARGDAQALAGFDENDYADNGGANVRSMSDLLAEYAAVRAATLALVNSFTPQQLQQRGTANNAGVTVNALLYILPGHERHHLNVFRERYLPVLGVA
ncbi:alpha/beta hydrolase-fold protein [Hymenobacter sp. ASUV-10]|uniref:Alpha/beta hydrolase-fold protein n=2 Tax=Hymenobacter aranciens TaxID=3063996 RepID=A0ABT9BCT6_9BACT|nr:alpha/beta hydrolase-fold protein [Hymenobacter sp. ASUV-10]MDO7876080.1 alpha/beta hydrolase-fold protein [Hymenobacter sp. ASUV-10]